MDAPRRLRYADGSGNIFSFERRADGAYVFSYEPVRPKTSSSGSYSGGAPKTGTVEAAELAALTQEARRLIQEGPILEHRVMGSGFLAIGEESWILGRSAALDGFEQRLRAI